jgi:hypothetical protein
LLRFFVAGEYYYFAAIISIPFLVPSNRNRQAIVQTADGTYRDKQEALDHLDILEKEKRPIHGLEIVQLLPSGTRTDMYKTLWVTEQSHVYDTCRAFIKEKMAGVWNYVEFKA